MQIQYIEPFIEATINVFREFFVVTPELRTPHILRRDEAGHWDVSGVIGIGGDARGVVVLSFSEAMALELTSQITGKTSSAIDDDVVDAVGEVVNIIAGNAKKGLENFRLVISLPSIIQGRDHSIAWPGKNVPIIGIPFRIASGEFLLSVGLENIITA